MNTILFREEFSQNFNILNNPNLELQKELVEGDESTFIPIFDNFPEGVGENVVGTQLRQANSEGLPTVINAGADGASLRLRLDTYNPTAITPGDSYLGSSIKTQDTFNIEDGGFAFEASLRLVDSDENPLSRGIIAGFFSYTPIIVDGTRDEIDFEILSNFINDGQNNNTEPSIFTNVFDGEDFEQRGDFSVEDLSAFPELEGIDLTEFNKYRIEWDTNGIKWFINDIEIRTETTTIPDRDMSVYLNIWANGFPEAFDASLLPASNLQSNQTFYYDVDYLQLERVNEPQQNIIIDLDDFSDTNQISFNGGSTIVENVLRLLPRDSIRGSAFYSSPINLESDTSFSTFFQIDINRINGGGDGFTFILQNDSRQDEALGGEGGNLGYSGSNPIDPSLTIQFDFFQNTIDEDPNDNHVGINLNGSKISVDPVATPDFDMDNTGNPVNVWIDYEGETNQLEVFLSETTEKPSTPLLQYEDDTIDLFNLLGEEAYIGFTSGQSSGTSADIDILNWEFSSDFVDENYIELFRFRNTTFETGTYLYVDAEEKDAILNNPDFNQTFELEGFAFKASLESGDDLIPFYRLRSLQIPGTYLFVSTEEYNEIFANDSDQRENWVTEGSDDEGNDIPEFYLYACEANLGTKFNRFQNTQNNTFLYAGIEESEAIEEAPNLSNLFTNQGCAFESI